MTSVPSGQNGPAAGGPERVAALSAWRGLRVVRWARVTEGGATAVLGATLGAVAAGHWGLPGAWAMSVTASVTAAVMTVAALVWSARVQRQLFPGWTYWQVHRRSTDLARGTDPETPGTPGTVERAARVAGWRLSVAVRVGWLFTMTTAASAGELFDVSRAAHPVEHGVTSVVLCGIAASVLDLRDVRRGRRRVATLTDEPPGGLELQERSGRR